MNDTFIIDYDPFAKESRVLLMHEGTKQHQYDVATDIPELADIIVQFANQHKVYDVKVRAPQQIIEEVQRCIAISESRLYEENKITVEGL